MSTKRKVLLIEDVHRFRDEMKTDFSTLEPELVLEVSEAKDEKNAEEIIRGAAAGNYDLVILDITLPYSGTVQNEVEIPRNVRELGAIDAGFRLLTLLRECRAFDGVPVVIHSNRRPALIRERMAGLGYRNVSHIERSGVPEPLLDEIRRLIS